MSEDTLDEQQIRLIETYSDMVYQMAYSLLKNPYDAEDIHQEVFVRYICKQPVFENPDHERAWFLRVTINLAKNFWKTAWYRKVGRFLDEGLEQLEMIPEEVTDPREKQIVELVGKLPLKYRAVIHLFYEEELSVEEIANLLKRKPSKVRTQLTRARSKLREWMKEEEDV